MFWRSALCQLHFIASVSINELIVWWLFFSPRFSVVIVLCWEGRVGCQIDLTNGVTSKWFQSRTIIKWTCGPIHNRSQLASYWSSSKFLPPSHPPPLSLLLSFISRRERKRSRTRSRSRSRRRRRRRRRMRRKRRRRRRRNSVKIKRAFLALQVILCLTFLVTSLWLKGFYLNIRIAPR